MNAFLKDDLQNLIFITVIHPAGYRSPVLPEDYESSGERTEDCYCLFSGTSPQIGDRYELDHQLWYVFQIDYLKPVEATDDPTEIVYSVLCSRDGGLAPHQGTKDILFISTTSAGEIVHNSDGSLSFGSMIDLKYIPVNRIAPPDSSFSHFQVFESPSLRVAICWYLRNSALAVA